MLLECSKYSIEPTYRLYNIKIPQPLYSMIRIVNFLLLADMIIHDFTTV